MPLFDRDPCHATAISFRFRLNLPTGASARRKLPAKLESDFLWLII